MDNWVFGCDICQDVCPWNRFSLAHTVDAFKPHQNMNEINLAELSQDVFNEMFKLSAIKRTKFKGLKRNVDFVLNKNTTK